MCGLWVARGARPWRPVSFPTCQRTALCRGQRRRNDSTGNRHWADWDQHLAKGSGKVAFRDRLANVWVSDRLQALPIMLRIWAMICQAWSGSPKNLLQGGGSVLGGFNCPDTAMILIAGQRLCTVCARPRPSILPGN